MANLSNCGLASTCRCVYTNYHMPNIEVTLGIGCSINCLYCPQETFVQAYRKRGGRLSMDLDSFCRYLERLPPYVGITFGGMSEPWHNPDCTKMIQEAHRKGRHITVFTTLSGMQPGDVEALERLPFDFFQIHLASSEAAERLRIDEAYLDVLGRISKSRIRPSFTSLGKSIHPRIKPLVKQKIHFYPVLSRAGNVCSQQVSTPGHKTGGLRCKFGLCFNILLPNADVLLCCMDYGLRHVLGNLDGQSYESLFRGSEFRRVQEGLRRDSSDIICRRCEFSFPAGRWHYLAMKVRMLQGPKDLLRQADRRIRRAFI